MADQNRSVHGKIYIATDDVKATSVDQFPTLSASGTGIALTSFTYIVDNEVTNGVADTFLTLGAAGYTITSAKYAAIRLELTPNGTVAFKTPGTISTTLAQAVEDLPAITAPSTNMSLGYVVVRATAATDFTLGTSKISETVCAGTTCMIYVFKEFERAYVGDFQGNVVMNQAGENLVWSGQEILAKSAELISIAPTLVVDQVAFRKDVLRQLWGATYSSLAILKGSTSADSYKWSMTSDMEAKTVEVLFDYDDSNGVRNQIWLAAAKAMSFPVTMGGKIWNTVDFTFQLFKDDDDKMYEWSEAYE